MKTSARQTLSNLYSLLMELNFHADDPGIWEDLNEGEKQRVNGHLKKLKLLRAKYRAEANKQYFHKAFEQIQILKEKGIEELKKLILPEQQHQLIPLFRKFEDISESDRSSILEDTELLSMIELLKEQADESDH